MEQTSRDIQISNEVYQKLRLLRSEFSTKLTEDKNWESFFGYLVSAHEKKKEIHSWLTTVGLFLLISFLIFILPLLAVELESVLPAFAMFSLMAAGAAAFSVYVLTSWVFRKNKPFTDATQELRDDFAELSEEAGLKRIPELRIASTPEINAIAYCTITGDNVCLTQGLVDS